MLSAMLWIALAGSTTHAAPDRAVRTVSVQLRGEVNVSPATLFGARADVTRLFRDAGVDLRWVSSGAEIVLELCVGRDARVLATSRHTLGQAVIDSDTHTGRLAYVFPERISDVATVAGLEPPSILGHVMAHEIAHLLGVVHAEGGLMRAGWTRPELTLVSYGLLDFSPAEREVLRQTPAHEQQRPLHLIDHARRGIRP